jgi:hypothetical protein
VSTLRRDTLADEVLALPHSRDHMAIKLRHDTTEASWQQRIHARTAWQIAVRDIIVHLQAGEDWIGQTLYWAEQGCLSWQASARLCDHISHTARRLGHNVLTHLRASDAALADTATRRGLALRHLYLAALRRDLRFGQMETFLTDISTEEGWDPFIQANYAVALLGQDRPDATFVADQTRLEAGTDPTCLHTLLQGLREAFALPGRAELMLTIADTLPTSAGPDPVVELRRGYALRILGRYSDALAAIDRGLTVLDPDEIHIHDELAAERALILADHQRASSPTRH